MNLNRGNQNQINQKMDKNLERINNTTNLKKKID